MWAEIDGYRSLTDEFCRQCDINVYKITIFVIDNMIFLKGKKALFNVQFIL